ncbi:MAG: hypothetical protein WCZ67_03665, partial [Bacteroidales bacterium]
MNSTFAGFIKKRIVYIAAKILKKTGRYARNERFIFFNDKKMVFLRPLLKESSSKFSVVYASDKNKKSTKLDFNRRTQQ